MKVRLLPLFALLLVPVLTGCSVLQGVSTDHATLRTDARHALASLLRQNPAARHVHERSVAVLVFPSIIKGGFLFGGQTGNGVLFKHGRVAGFYNTTSVSYGLQAGVQDFGYALFFMNSAALRHLDKTAGFEVGVGPSLVVANEGFMKTYSTTTLQKDIYAFGFNQRGIMAGMGISGSKITRISRP